MSQYKAGTFTAKVEDFGITTTKAGDPQVFVAFSVDFDPNAEAVPMTWYGSFKGGALDITLKALAVLGLKGVPEDLAKGPSGDAIMLGTPAKVVVKEEPRQDGTGTYFKLAFVNSIHGRQGQAIQRMDGSQARAALAKLNLRGELERVRRENPDLNQPAPAPAAPDMF